MNVSSRVALALVLALVASLPCAAAADKALDAGMALKVVNLFAADPLGKDSAGLSSLIVRFAEDSDEVTVVIDEKLAPFMDSDEHQSVLLTAYVAGSLRSQLELGVDRNDTYSGLLMMLRVYRLLKQTEPELEVASIERLAELDRNGSLLKHVVETQAAEDSPAKAE